MDHIHNLKAMEIDVWVRRDMPALENEVSAPSDTAVPGMHSAVTADEVRARSASPTEQHNEAEPAAAVASVSPPVIAASLREDISPATENSTSPPAEVSSAAAIPSPAEASDDQPTYKSLADLRQTVATCARCELHRSRTQTVFGVGDPNAQLLVIGEAPGAEEDRRGEPFVGPAGQLLNAMLQAIGIRRDTAYIANILKCRPPNNRDPHNDEVAHCAQYLSAQVQLIAPRVILTVGRIAAQNLLGETTPIGKMRGRRYTYADTEIPVIVTYHPAYLLRSPQEKSKAWQDLKLVRSLLEEPPA